jgi:hypothetical protein
MLFQTNSEAMADFARYTVHKPIGSFGTRFMKGHAGRSGETPWEFADDPVHQRDEYYKKYDAAKA